MNDQIIGVLKMIKILASGKNISRCQMNAQIIGIHKNNQIIGV